MTISNTSIEPTPNPNALKFILDKCVKTEDSSTYRTPSECGNNQLALKIFYIRGIDQIHFHSNVITITKFSYEDWENLESEITNVIDQNIAEHDPSYIEIDPEKERRKSLGPELLKIEEIIDKTIRPGLQGDGGDIQCISFDDHVLIVRYQGACGTCPSSTTGTLEAIKGILREKFDPDINIYIAPDY